jgi:Protein of unknown function (DUF5818)
MKKLGLAVIVLVSAASLSLAVPKLSLHKNGKDKTFSGVIMDSQCAMMGSHEKMEKMHSDMFKKPSAALTGPEARKCTLACVKQGGQFVLYNKATKTTYKLDDQEKPREFAGERVKVSGTYDASTMTIHVESIRKAVI